MILHVCYYTYPTKFAKINGSLWFVKQIEQRVSNSKNKDILYNSSICRNIIVIGLKFVDNKNFYSNVFNPK